MFLPKVSSPASPKNIPNLGTCCVWLFINVEHFEPNLYSTLNIRFRIRAIASYLTLRVRLSVAGTRVNDSTTGSDSKTLGMLDDLDAPSY